MNKREEEFAEFLINQNKSFSFEPLRFQLKNTKYTPDFYCPEDDTFYEVVGSRQAIHANKIKILEFKKKYPDLKFELVKPNGKKYSMKKQEAELMPRIVLIRLPNVLYDRLHILKKREHDKSISAIIRESIVNYLNKRKGDN